MRAGKVQEPVREGRRRASRAVTRPLRADSWWRRDPFVEVSELDRAQGAYCRTENSMRELSAQTVSSHPAVKGVN
jgi:hypothetical protein